ncbi:hypothetical protein COOONC_23311 [Cooperia oncophora]
MSRLLAQDSTAGRLRAITELRSLRMRPNQEVADFCVAMERLGQQANPDSTIEDRSLEYAQILLDNLAEWPGRSRVYDEIKQLALSIEQSRLMLDVNKENSCTTLEGQGKQLIMREPQPDTKEKTLSSIIRQARCMGLRVEDKREMAGKLIGHRITVLFGRDGSKMPGIDRYGIDDQYYPGGTAGRDSGSRL